MNFIIRWLVTAVAVGVAVWLVPGMELLGGTDAWVGIAIFSLIQMCIRDSHCTLHKRRRDGNAGPRATIFTFRCGNRAYRLRCV